MKIIVTHTSPDWDAIGSVWLLRRFLPGWQEAKVEFVPAGERYKGLNPPNPLLVKGEKGGLGNPIEKVGGDEVVHVDTGLGPLDHHQILDTNVSAAGLTWDFVKLQYDISGLSFSSEHKEAVSRVVGFIVDTDHFKEVFWEDPAADYHEFTLLGLLEGVKQEVQDNDMFYVEFGVQCLNAMVHTFENRIWAEKEIQEKGVAFETKYGKAMGFETINDTVLKLAQKMGYELVVRKDPWKGYVRIKALPERGDESRITNYELRTRVELDPRLRGDDKVSGNDKEGEGKMKKGIDLTLGYEKLKKVDPDATWFLHVSKKMLLNGSPKNPKMRATKLSLGEIIKVLESVYSL